MKATKVRAWNCETAWEIQSDSGNVWTVKKNTIKPHIEGLSCNCPSWTRNPKFDDEGHRYCKHTIYVRDEVMNITIKTDAMTSKKQILDFIKEFRIGVMKSEITDIFGTEALKLIKSDVNIDTYGKVRLK